MASPTIERLRVPDDIRVLERLRVCVAGHRTGTTSEHAAVRRPDPRVIQRVTGLATRFIDRAAMLRIALGELTGTRAEGTKSERGQEARARQTMDQSASHHAPKLIAGGSGRPSEWLRTVKWRVSSAAS